jgi:hypothetical protein
VRKVDRTRPKRPTAHGDNQRGRAPKDPAPHPVWWRRLPTRVQLAPGEADAAGDAAGEDPVAAVIAALIWA